MTNKTGYSAVLLDNQSQDTLKQILSVIQNTYPVTRQFEFIKCEHMVIRFGHVFSEDGDDRKEPTIGTPVRLKCRQFGFNEKAVAVHVNRIERTIDNKPVKFKDPHNEIYHITLAHKGPNDADESNHIEYWKSITSVGLSELVLNGTICEFSHELFEIEFIATSFSA